jgi:hypothetical protein
LDQGGCTLDQGAFPLTSRDPGPGHAVNRITAVDITLAAAAAVTAAIVADGGEILRAVRTTGTTGASAGAGRPMLITSRGRARGRPRGHTITGAAAAAAATHVPADKIASA